MGNKRRKSRKRGHRFNISGGIASKTYKSQQKKTFRAHKLELTRKSTCKSVPYRVKGRKNLKFVFSKIALTKAKKFIATRNSNNLKVTINAFDNKESIPGNRIINLDELQKYVCEISMHSATCEGARSVALNDGSPVKLVSEERNGFYVVLKSKCVGCDKVFQLKNSEEITTETGNKIHDINVRGVWGSMVSGGGCSKLAESMGTMGVPSVHNAKYSQIEHQIGQWWGEVLEEEMKKAGEEERQHAIETNSFFEGVPAVTIVCDGGWSKRSHKHSHNAMAGVGVIFGLYSKKLLHIGVKNRLCYICSVAENKNIDPKPHDCFKNWTESAQAMESDIILEGFLNCESKYGVRYMYMIGDGDSSVYATIQQQVPVWGAHVTKIECANHSCKCLRVHLEQLVADKPQYKGKGKLTKKAIQSIVTGVRCAIRMRSKEPASSESIKNLKSDIRNAGRHVLGLHDLCSTDFCKHNNDDGKDKEEINDCEQEDEDIIYEQCNYWQNVVKEPSEGEVEAIRKGGEVKAVEEGMLKDLYVVLNRTAEKADRLIGNFTSNLAESWMNIRCKFDGGKVTNRCFRGSFLARCYGGGLRAMKGPAWSPIVYGQVTGNRPDDIFVNTYRQRSRRYLCTKKYHSTEAYKKKRNKRKLATSKLDSTKKARRSYGNVLDDSEDAPAEEVTETAKTYYESEVNVSEDTIRSIEKHTKGQSNNMKWKEERRKRLTSSVFGDVMTRSVNNNSPALTNRLLYSNFQGNKFTRKGLLEEDNTRKEYINIKQKEGEQININVPGLIISKEHPHLATSSDGIVTSKQSATSGLIEIKNLLQNSDKNIKDAAINNNQFCLQYENQTVKLKKNHKFYYQVQGQMNICDLPWCDFVVRRTNPYDIFIERIYRDKRLWQEEMEPKLSAFYFSHILPELSAPRKHSITGIRKPAIPWVQTYLYLYYTFFLISK